MPNYTYTARDFAGELKSGTTFAESETHLRDVLRHNGLFLTKYTKTIDKTAQRRQSLFAPRKVKLGDMVVMSRQFATLIRAGLPIVEALGTVSQQTENLILSDALRDVRLEVLAGSTLSGAMRNFPEVFNELYISLVEAGEAGGVLDQTLEVAADQFDKEAELREKVKSALTYPKLVVVAAIGVVVFMLVYIVPVFSNVYKSFKKDLPAITQALVALSDFLLKYWWLAAGVAALIIFGYRQYRKTYKGRRVTDQAALKLWIVGPVLRKVAIARFTETWAGATKGGIPILKALTISSNTAGNTIISDAIISILPQVEAGAPVSPLLDGTDQFPPMVTRMIAAGEKAGNLDYMLTEVSRFYKRDVDYSVDRMTKMLEPAMTVIVGGIVLFVLLALYMPVFNLGNVIKR